jgi:membrane-bound lytic murein transglycosylase D
MNRRRLQKLDLRRMTVGLTLTGMLCLGAWTAGTVRQPSGMDTATSARAAVEGPAASMSSVQMNFPGWDMPVTRNDRVEYWIRFLSTTRRVKMQQWLEASGRYVPMIQGELRERGMPQDLIYLALIESGFAPNAYSKANAVGLWQFIAETGRRQGLEVSEYVDERRDPVKATGAALDFLKSLHTQFGSWYLAAAAYNSGPNRIERLLREHEGGARGDEELYWRIAPYLPQETRDYVPLMLAAGFIAKDPASYGFSNLNYDDPLGFATVSVPGATSLSTVAKASATDDSIVRGLNPQLVVGSTPPGRATDVRIPEMHAGAFAANFTRVAAGARAVAARTPVRKSSTRSALQLTKKHVVRRGETLAAIARKYRVTVASLRAANNGVSARTLKAGKVLRVPHARTRVALN